MISIIKNQIQEKNQIQGKNGYIIRANEKLYDFTLEYLKTNKYISSRNLARAYHNIRFRKPIGSETYELSRVILVLKKENIIENHSRITYKRID